MTRIKNTSDLLAMLDDLFREPAQWWNNFYQDKNKGVPFFIDHPDENLVSYFTSGSIKPGRVLEIGCGNGRNAIFMARQGCQVEALDISMEAIEWARANAAKQNVTVNFNCGNIFETRLEEQTYDFVYDCGLLHHLLPHQRFVYIENIAKSLRPGGHFGIVCFAPGFEEISGVKQKTDESIYKVYSMQGGIAYAREDLNEILEEQFEEVEVRLMKECTEEQQLFGKEFLWAGLWKRTETK